MGDECMGRGRGDAGGVGGVGGVGGPHIDVLAGDGRMTINADLIMISNRRTETSE